jgi:predicted transcriptional regulator
LYIINRGQRMSDKSLEERIIELLKKRPTSVSQLSRELNLRREFLSGYMESMRARGMLEMVKVGRSYVYIPKK